MEVAHLRVELGVSLPGGRNEHRECVPRVAAAAHQQLERVVEHARVRARFFEYGSVDAQRQRAGTHPVDVAPNCVDLPVVAEEPERLRSLPGRLGIRREALVEDAERNLEGRVAQVGVERSELIGRAERLVDNRAERERGDVEVFAAVQALAGAECSRLADLGIARRPFEERLFDCRRRGPSRRAQCVEVDGDRPPGTHRDPLCLAGLLDRAPSIRTAEEDHRDSHSSFGHQSSRQRQEEARAVAGAVIRRHGSPVADTPQCLEEGVEHRPRRATGEPGDEADATGIAFVDRRIKRGKPCQLRTFSFEGESPARWI